MPGVNVVSRDWDEVVGEQHSLQEPLGTSSHEQRLHEPLRGWNAFSATFRVMFKEEGRKSIEFAKKRQIVLFPLLLTLVTAVTTIGLQFLVGDSSAQVSDLESKTFTWNELRFALHLPLLMFSLGMGTFAFMGHDAIVHRAGTKNYLLAAPALQPLPNSVAHFAYFVKDLCFYVMLILTPVVSGMALGILLESVANITTPLEWSSLPWTWFAMIITLAQGLAIAFFASALWMRGRPYTIVGPVAIVILGIAIGLGKLDIGSMLWGLGVQNSQSPTTALLALVGSLSLIHI